MRSCYLLFLHRRISRPMHRHHNSAPSSGWVLDTANGNDRGARPFSLRTGQVEGCCQHCPLFVLSVPLWRYSQPPPTVLSCMQFLVPACSTHGSFQLKDLNRAMHREFETDLARSGIWTIAWLQWSRAHAACSLPQCSSWACHPIDSYEIY